MEIKKCSKCKKVKIVFEFYKHPTTIDGLTGDCKTCRKQYSQENKEKITQREKQYQQENRNKITQRVGIRRYLLKIEENGFKSFAKNILPNKVFKDYDSNKIFYPNVNINLIKNFIKKENYESDDLNILKDVYVLRKHYYILKNYEKNSCKIKIKRSVTDKIYRLKNKEYYRNYTRKWQKNKRQTDPIFKFKHNVRTSIGDSFKRGKNNYTKKTKTEQILGCDIDFFRKYIESKFTKGMTFDNYGEWHLDHIIPLATAETEEDVVKLNHYTNFQPLWAFDNISKGGTINEPTQVVLRL